MSVEKKKYIAPKYEMVKFDSQIMTGWWTGCWGVIGNDFDGTSFTANTCETTYDHGENILPIDEEYYD